MTHHRSPSGDPELTRVLRDLYAPPGAGDERYWDVLEARILAHVAGADATIMWWSELRDMMRPGLIAAAALMFAAGLAMMQSRQTEARNAYASIISPAPSSIEPARSATTGDGDAAIHLLLSH